MVHKYDTERAVGLLRQYQANLTTPEEEALKTSVGKVSAIFGSQLFQALLDIQECYEVTLQSNTELDVVKEEDVVQNASEEEQEEGVSRVRVTCRKSPHKVEQVSCLVSRSHVDMPKFMSLENCPSDRPGDCYAWRRVGRIGISDMTAMTIYGTTRPDFKLGEDLRDCEFNL